jgi:hypothetical protein
MGFATTRQKSVNDALVAIAGSFKNPLLVVLLNR